MSFMSLLEKGLDALESDKSKRINEIRGEIREIKSRCKEKMKLNPTFEDFYYKELEAIDKWKEDLPRKGDLFIPALEDYRDRFEKLLKDLG